MRSALTRALDEAERDTLSELDAVRRLIVPAVEAAAARDCAAADAVAGGAARLDERYAAVHDELLALVARQAPVAGDLRLAVALLHVNDRIARMAAQARNIATLCGVMPADTRPSDEQIACVRAMAGLADEAAAESAHIFATRDVDGVARLAERDAEMNRRNLHCFRLAVSDGADASSRETAFLVALMARALERFGDNAVDIGRQARFAARGDAA